jgi:hypothetical protein
MSHSLSRTRFDASCAGFGGLGFAVLGVWGFGGLEFGGLGFGV